MERVARYGLALSVLVVGLLASACDEAETEVIAQSDTSNPFESGSAASVSPSNNPFKTTNSEQSQTGNLFEPTKPGVPQTVIVGGQELIVGSGTVTELKEGASSDRPIKVSAKSLYKDREGNPVRFGEKYGFPLWLKITGTVDRIADGAISMEELRPGLGWSSSFGVMKIADGSKGRELVLSATMGKSLTVTCLMSPKSAYMGERYNFEQCQTP